MGGYEDSVSVDRVRFDDNVSFIEASSSPVSVGSARSRVTEKNSENFQPKTDPVHGLSKPLGVSKSSSGASTSSGDKRTAKLRKSSPFTEVDLSGIEISVDGKPLDVIVEPTNITGSLNDTVAIEVDQPSNLEVSTL